MYWPQIFANVSVSGGVPNTIYQVFILMLILGIVYIAGWFAQTRKNVLNNKYVEGIWLFVVILLCIFTVMKKGTIKESVDYVTMQYMESGQAEDYRSQMDEFTRIMTDPDITDARVHASNCDQGPLMHMPITENPDSFTNKSAAKFFGKNSVVAVGR
jgi:hypothetical protein